MLNTSHKMTLNYKISEAAWTVREERQLNVNRYVKVKQSHYRPGQVQRVPGSCFPDFMTTAQDGGKVVSLTHRPPLSPTEILLVLISVTG